MVAYHQHLKGVRSGTRNSSRTGLHVGLFPKYVWRVKGHQKVFYQIDVYNVGSIYVSTYVSLNLSYPYFNNLIKQYPKPREYIIYLHTHSILLFLSNNAKKCLHLLLQPCTYVLPSVTYSDPYLKVDKGKSIYQFKPFKHFPV